MASPALRHKIAKTKAAAPLELGKARICAQVILAAADGDTAMETALQLLKKELGNNWTVVTAMQFMSGRRGAFAAECGQAQERAQLYLAHLVAKKICSAEGLGAVEPVGGADLAKFYALVAAHLARGQ